MSTAAAWHNLGDKLISRRVQLGYTSRKSFTDATSAGKASSWYRMITDVENGNRANYDRSTLAMMEIAYQLQPGTIAAFLAKRRTDLEPATHQGAGQAAGLDTVEAKATVDPEKRATIRVVPGGTVIFFADSDASEEEIQETAKRLAEFAAQLVKEGSDQPG